MKKLRLDPESLTVETFDASDYPHVAKLETDGCQDTYQTTGYWICAADCGTGGNSCAC